MIDDLRESDALSEVERLTGIALVLARALVRSRLSARSNQLDDRRHDGLMSAPVDGPDWPEPPEPVMEVTG